MRIDVFQDADAVAERAAEIIAAKVRETVAKRGRFVMAVSGGHTPWRMLTAFGQMDVPWANLHVAQVDERIAPAGDPDRNLTQLASSLLEFAPLRPGQIHAMPVELTDLSTAATQYAATLQSIAGSPPVLDLIHLGLGSDGHTASLVPGDAVLDLLDVDVGVTGVYQGRRRMTLTYPALNRARRILWLVTGEAKARQLNRLRDRDRSIPAGRVRQDRAMVLADTAAAALLNANELER
jgi:6-phosphogluconolactonase